MVLVGEGHEAPAGEHFTCDLLAVGALLAVRHRREDSWWWALAMPDLLARCLSGVPGTLLLGPDTIDNEQDVIPELFGRWDHDLEPAWSPGEQLSFDSLLGHTGP